MCFFFFQAEDGIRDYDVTGVQTCALPILVAFGAVPTVYHLIGGVIILAGVVYSQVKSHAAKRDSYAKSCMAANVGVQWENIRLIPGE